MTDEEKNSPPEVSQLLVAWGNGDPAALEKLLPLVHDELRRIAARHMRRERPGHTLQTSALVNEAYMKLVNQRQANWQNRLQFFGVAAQAMRRILLDHARSAGREKRGGGARAVSLDEAALAAGRSEELLALDEALTQLEQFDARKCRVVEMRFFGGLSNEEIAAALDVSERTVEREWRKAKAWLHRAIEIGPGAATT